MSGNDRAVLVGVIAVVALAAVGAAVHLVPWLRDNRTDISLFLLMLLLTASGFTAALALITTYVDRPTSADNADTDIETDEVDTDADMACPTCGEPAREGTPTDLVPAHYTGQKAPEWSHADGTQLCPVIGSDGYRPADPIRIRTSLPESSETL
jgi:hypothetical protein